MFSGIIDAVGRISQCRNVSSGKALIIHVQDYWSDVPTGGSIAVDGVCLTLTRADGDESEFDVIAETLRRTTLGELRDGDEVNLQKSMAVGDRIDGHFVQGHVDAVATVSRIEQSSRESLWWFSMDAEPMAYITPKGSVAIDGVSLTVAEVRNDEFSVALIPTTLERTTIGQKKVGSRVNIETDVLARTVVHYLKRTQGSTGRGGISSEFLSRHDFA
ncbi:MAG: riboflavin synthase [Phycisphaerales bacterium]|nr:riboflavin synthase [Phycisphaerales bacterium]